GEKRPPRYFRQEIGDADARQHGIEARGQGLGLRRRRFLDRRDFEHALVDRHVGQQATLRTSVNRRQPFVQNRATALDETVEVRLDRDRQRVGLLQVLQGLFRDQPFLEGAVLPAADDPYVAGAQPVAQLRQHVEFVVTTVDGAAGQHVRR